MTSHWITEEINHLKECGGTVEHIGMIIASDHFRKMGVMEVQEACKVLKSDYPEILEDMKANYPHYVKE